MRALLGSCGLWAMLAGWTAAVDLPKLPDVRTINTSGESVIYTPPDEVVISFTIETAQPELDKAHSLNEEAGVRLIKAIKALGVEAKHIQTDNLDVEIRYKEPNSLLIAGYVLRRGYAVTLKDTKKFEQLVDAALRNGANRLSGFEYRTTELRKFRDQARLLAIKAAHEKATSLSEALNCQVGPPRAIQEGSGQWSYWGGRGFNAMSQNTVQVAPGAGGDGGESTPLGQIAIRAQVSVTFDLVPFGK